MINMRIKFNPKMHYTGEELNAFLSDMVIQITRNISPVSIPAGLEISISSDGEKERNLNV